MIDRLRQLDSKMTTHNMQFELTYHEDHIGFHYEIWIGWELKEEDTIIFNACDQSINDRELNKQIDELYSIYT